MFEDMYWIGMNWLSTMKRERAMTREGKPIQQSIFIQQLRSAIYDSGSRAIPHR